MQFFRKNLLWVLLLCAGVSLIAVDQQFAPTQEMTDAYQIHTEMGAAVVRVNRPNFGGGSGTVIYQDDKVAHVLTNWHVIAGPGEVTVSWHNGMYHEVITSPAKVLRSDPHSDLALLETQPVWRGVARVVTQHEFDRYVSIYQRVLVLGFPATIWVEGDSFVHSAHLTEGWLSDLNDRDHLRISAQITYGNSGSGLFMKVKGRWMLVGVIRAVKTVDGHQEHPLPHIGFAVRPENVLDFLSR